MPPALARKYPGAATSWEWQYVFPSRDLSVDPRTLVVKRHHFHPSGVQKAINAAVRAAGMTKRATAHTLRAAFAHRLKEAGYQLDDIQQLMGHADIRTTQHYLEGQAPACKRLRGPHPPEPEAALWLQRRDDHPNLHFRGAIGCIPPAGWRVPSSPSCHVGSPGGCFLTTSRHGRRSILPFVASGRTGPGRGAPMCSERRCAVHRDVRRNCALPF